jgi:hypothetical protein
MVGDHLSSVRVARLRWIRSIIDVGHQRYRPALGHRDRERDAVPDRHEGPPRTDPVTQVHLGRSIVNLLLLHALSRSPAVETGQTRIGPIMLQLFALLCRPEGQDLLFLREMASGLARAMRDGDAAVRRPCVKCGCWTSSG